MPFSNFKLFIVFFFLLKCCFSRPKKYFVFFSPSLYQRVFDLIIEPFVLYSISFSNSCLYPSSCIVRVSRSTSVMLSSKPFCRFAILDSKSTYLLFIYVFFCLAYTIELARTSILITSQSKTSSTSLSFLYCFDTSEMVLLISSTNSWSYCNEVFSFQKPGPLGFVCKSIARVTIEWSVL